MILTISYILDYFTDNIGFESEHKKVVQSINNHEFGNSVWPELRLALQVWASAEKGDEAKSHWLKIRNILDV